MRELITAPSLPFASFSVNLHKSDSTGLFKLLRLLLIGAVLLACEIVASESEPVMPTENLQRLMETSQWVFNGTVEKVSASTLRVLASSPRTVAVKINSVLYGPPQFNDHLNRLVTVYLVEGAAALQAGQQLTFFTRSWLYGETLAVVEVGRMDETKAPDLKTQIAQAGQNLADQHLQNRLSRAELVVVGKVRSVEPTSLEQRQRIQSEHNPDWWQADIDVESVEKGTLTAKTVSVLFPHSGDEMWAESPKFTAGQEGVWILQRNQQEKGMPIMRAPGLTALHPLDYQTRDQLPRLRKLLGRG